MMIVENRGIHLTYDQEKLSISIKAKDALWTWQPEYEPYFMVGEERIFFKEADTIDHMKWSTGVGEGIRTTFKGFNIQGEQTALAFETIVWIEYATNDIFFELVPLQELEGLIGNFYWPGEIAFKEASDKWYSVVNILQGMIIPNTWKEEVTHIVFDGQMCSTAAYMPWFGQVKPEGGYMMIAQHPWDTGYQIDHPEESDYCHLGLRHLPSLGKIGYKRSVRMNLFESGCDYNDLCKCYRQYAKERGLFVTLKEKTAKNPLVDKFIGSAIVHTGIKTHVSEDSAYYNKENPEKNDFFIPFEIRLEQMKKLKAKGLDKVYLHLDGWGNPGYDNQHPDYLPACIEAGGWEGMRALSDGMQEMNYMFAIHDQYRDYYYNAKTFDKEFRLHYPDGTNPDFARWAGGWQSYICASQSLYYLKRNFTEIFNQGIHLEGTYLDVFTCNEADECIHPWHQMTRKDCIDYRKGCFDYLLANNILPSSEEVVDWAIPSIVTAHYGPYDFMLAPTKPLKGIPVPLFNLVYHECVALPWLMEQHPVYGDYMLYALLNGGSAYLNCELEGEALDEAIERYEIVARLQEKIAHCEMVKHTLLNLEGTQQSAEYSDGTKVTIDLKEGTYTIEN